MRSKRFVLAASCLALLLILDISAGFLFHAPPDIPTFEGELKPYSMPTGTYLNDTEQQLAAAIVREILADPGAKPLDLKNAHWKDRLIVVGVFPRSAEPLIGWTFAAGDLDLGLAEAARNAITRPGLKTGSRDLSESSIRIDLVRRIWEIRPREGDPLGFRMRIGVDGLLRVDKDRAMLMAPYEILLNPWEPAMGKRSRIRKAIMRRELSERAGVSERDFLNAPIYRFRGYSYIQASPTDPIFRLLNGNLKLEAAEVTPDVIENALVSGTNYLVRVLEHGGDPSTFAYLYDPAVHVYNGPLKYNSVRHAGCVYGMYELGKALGDPKIIDAADRGMLYLRRHLRHPWFHRDALCVRKMGVGSLGAAALTLLSFQAMPENRRQPGDWEIMLELARYIELLEHPDGRFYTDYHELVFNEPLTQAPYFPGEALLAMSRLANDHPELEWVKETAVRAADWQIEEFGRTGKPENWVVQGLAYLYRATGDEQYADTSFAMADLLVESQFGLGSNRADWIGGFSNSKPPRTAPAGSRSEALREAYLLAVELGDMEKIERYGNALILAARFIITQMYGPPTSYYLPYPEQAQGGIRGSPIQSLIRIDYNQHALVGMLGAWDAAKRLGPISDRPEGDF